MSKPIVYIGASALVLGSGIYAFYPIKEKKNIPKTKNYVPSAEAIEKIKKGKYPRYDDVGFVPFSRVQDNLNASELLEWSKSSSHQFTGDAFIYALDSWFWGMDMRSKSKHINDFQEEIKSFIIGGGAIDRLLIDKGHFLPSELKSNE